MVPNIFDYATKELSQDALICWLVACARDADGELRELGLDFVRALMRSGEGAEARIETTKTSQNALSRLVQPAPSSW